jgi:signal transduction histidine kinase/tetratricopeptide (TPR) repeat protein
MFGNLRQVLRQNRKFLATYLFVVFVPSIVLAILGARAIFNERYKLQQTRLEQQRVLVNMLKAEVNSMIEREISGLREIAASRSLIDRDYELFRRLVVKSLRDSTIIGRIAVYQNGNSIWFPEFAARPDIDGNPKAAAEWKRLQSDLDRAEDMEFRSGNISGAAGYYRQILRRAREKQVKAWILSRITRCEAKQGNYQSALTGYQHIVDDFPDLLTESGRDLGIVVRLGILEILLTNGDAAAFFTESLQTLESLDGRFWFIASSQVQMYREMIHRMIEEAVSVLSLETAPVEYQPSIALITQSIDNKLIIRRMAENAEQSLQPFMDQEGNPSSESRGLRKKAFLFEGQDVLALIQPCSYKSSGGDRPFLVSFMGSESWSKYLGAYVSSSVPQGSSILLRSNLSGKVLYGRSKTEDSGFLLSDMFPENFPPWTVEVYQSEGVAEEFYLTRNIFFWIILALLAIVIFGSALIIRSIVQEVNLLNLKSEFIASVSHEFKTPLAAISAVLERLLSDTVTDPKKTREYYHLLSHDSGKLKRLVKNILDFTKIEEKKREYNLAETDIKTLVQQEVEGFRKEHMMEGYEVDLTVEDHIPAVSVDKEAVRQALHNILDNAAKFSKMQKKIDVDVRRKRDSVEIAVSDRGIGIPEDERKKVFDKFYRGKHAASISPTGTGLGLTLVKHIMDGHGGDVVIAKRLGRGCRVSLILPLGKGE